MASRLSKNVALMLFCYFRQAERSVDHALPLFGDYGHWPKFIAYYGAKQAQIAEVIAMLKDAGGVQNGILSRSVLAENELLGIGRQIVGMLCNPLKRSWSFSVPELSFFSATLEHLLRIIMRNPELPKIEELVELRMDCATCELAIGRKLIGVPEIKRAQLIENFNQPEFLSHVTFADLGIQNL